MTPSDERAIMAVRLLAFRLWRTPMLKDWRAHGCLPAHHHIRRRWGGWDRFLAAAGEGDRYVACEVAVADIVVHARPDYPDKIKARRCKALYEVDREGNRIEEAPASETA